MKNLYERLRDFDWTWFYSDEYIHRWDMEEKAIKALLKNLDCPYTFRQVESAINGFVIEDSILKEDGYYLKIHLEQKWNMAALSESEMITKAIATEVIDWIKRQSG